MSRHSLCKKYLESYQELNQLSDMILPPTMVSKVTGAFSVKDTLPSAFHNTKTQWRKSDCKYVTNEIKIDIIEAIDCILQASSAFKAKAIVSFINGQLPLDITPNIKLNKSHSTVKIEINKSMNVDKTIDKILLEIPFPAETLSFTLSATDCKSWNSCYAFEIKGLSLSNLRIDSNYFAFLSICPSKSM
eukprot:510697_1